MKHKTHPCNPVALSFISVSVFIFNLDLTCLLCNYCYLVLQILNIRCFVFCAAILTLILCVYRSIYEEGRFCDTFHVNASGWRCCESCGKVSRELSDLFIWFFSDGYQICC